MLLTDNVSNKTGKPEERKAIQVKSDNDLVIMLSDLHIGQTFHSAWGNYDLDIAKDRMNQ